MPPSRLVILVGVTLVGFASNSLLARAALDGEATDAATFTAIRVVSGAVMLLALHRLRSGGRRDGSWTAAAMLFLYAIAFSASYVRIPAGVGALVLFGAVQMTMIGWGVRSGERMRMVQWLGLVVASAGLVALTRPGLAAPDPIGAVLMLVAGAAWGVYSLIGRRVADPVAATAGNFVRASLLAVAALAISLSAGIRPRLTAAGAVLAVVSGAIASGLVYSLWYAALPHITRMRAAIVQLGVPVVAAIGAVVLLDEPVTGRAILAGTAILGGVAVAIGGRVDE